MRLYGFKIEYKEEKGLKAYFKKLENYCGIVLALDENTYYLVYEDNEIGRILMLLLSAKLKGKEFRVLDEANVKVLKQLEPLPPEYIPILKKLDKFVRLYYKFENPAYIFYKAVQELKDKLEEDEKLALKKLIMETLDNKELIEAFIDFVDGRIDERAMLSKFQDIILQNVLDIDEFIKLLPNLIEVQVFLGKEVKVKVADTLALTLDIKKVLDFDKKGNIKHFLSYAEAAKILALVTSTLKDLNVDEVIELAKELRDPIEDIIRKRIFEEIAKRKILPFQDEKEYEAIEEFLHLLNVYTPIFRIKNLDELSNVRPKAICFILDNYLIVPATVFKYIKYPRKLLKFLYRHQIFLFRKQKMMQNKRVWLYFIDLNKLKEYFPEASKIEEIADDFTIEEEIDILKELEKAADEQNENESQ